MSSPLPRPPAADSPQAAPALPDCLSGAEARAALARARVRRLGAGAPVLRQGEPADGVVLVLEGHLRLVREHPDGRRHALGTLGPGQCWCLPGGASPLASPVTLECRTSARVARIPAGDLEPLFAGSPGFAGAVAACLGGRIAALHDRLEQTARLAVLPRLARLLVDLAASEGRPVSDGVRIDGHTHAALAEALGTAREVVSRALARLRRLGHVRAQGRGLVVRDLSGLERLADPDTGALPDRER